MAEGRNSVCLEGSSGCSSVHPLGRSSDGRKSRWLMTGVLLRLTAEDVVWPPNEFDLRYEGGESKVASSFPAGSGRSSCLD